MTFGVEIEFKFKGRNHVKKLAKALVEHNLSNCDEVRTCKSIEDVKGWKIITEKTCNYELISPILMDSKKCWEKLNTICYLLTKYGAYTDEDCAFHVHIGTEDLFVKEKQWVQLLEVYRQVEPMTHLISKGSFDCVSPRRLKRFAFTQAMAEHKWCKGDDIETYKEKITLGRLDLVAGFHQPREVGMNFKEAYNDSHMIEFRTFNGTVDFFLMQNYLMYICNLVDKVALEKEISLPIDNILRERRLEEEYTDQIIAYLTEDEIIAYRLKQLVSHCGHTLTDFTWDMLKGLEK